jgi:signal transduction histidine kinase
MNLLTNARDALNDKYPGYDEDKNILLSCEPIEKDNGQNLRITIEDHGNGIPPDVQEKMFDQFFTTKEIEKGTGLGLYISLEIIKEHKGELTYKTEEGKCTQFYLDLPVGCDCK